MDLKEIEETDLWILYQKSISYARLVNIYTDTDRNYRMYNGNQWYGLKCVGIEPVQLNYIKPIVNFKVGKINSNLWAINYSNENYENENFRETGNKLCKLLNKKAAKIWEKDGLDYKIRVMTTDSAVNDEGIIYAYWDEETKMPVNEVLSKNDVYYGNENSDNIQKQPYIIIKKRVSLVEAMDIAKETNAKIDYIRGDNDNLEEAGEQAKYEKDPMVTVLIKLYKKNGTVHYDIATRYCSILKGTNSGLKYYPLIHMPWSLKKGSSRGEGVVRNLIPNQIEVNKTLMRRALVAKNTAYPQKVVDISKIVNPKDIEKVGATIRVNGQSVEDVRKVFNNTIPAQMSSDVERLQNDLIQVTRDLEGAGDIATGTVNPEDASGKAILAVQRASEMPIAEQTTYLKSSLEDLARIWFDMIVNYSGKKIKLEEEKTDQETGETYIQLVEYPIYMLEELRLSVKIDITPKSAYDKYAQEVSLENLLQAGYFSQQKLSELKVYAKLLDDDSVMNKQKLLEAIKEIENEQRKIAEIEARTQLKIQQAQQFLNGDSDTQAEQIMNAKMKNEIMQQLQYVNQQA